jgi:hypothetical protein
VDPKEPDEDREPAWLEDCANIAAVLTLHDLSISITSISILNIHFDWPRGFQAWAITA